MCYSYFYMLLLFLPKGVFKAFNNSINIMIIILKIILIIMVDLEAFIQSTSTSLKYNSDLYIIGNATE